MAGASHPYHPASQQIFTRSKSAMETQTEKDV